MGTEVDILHSQLPQKDFTDLAEHPLTLTQRLQDEGEDKDSKRVTYVRPDFTIVTINTSQLCDHYYHALLYS